jgi:hypothetical protein
MGNRRQEPAKTAPDRTVEPAKMDNDCEHLTDRELLGISGGIVIKGEPVSKPPPPGFNPFGTPTN